VQHSVGGILFAAAVTAAPLTKIGQAACPPSCATNELLGLLDTYCSDKGTFWQSKHHYATAYHSIFGSLRETVQSMLEIGIGEDTAPSVQAWATYFPNAHIYPVDIKTRKEVLDRARAGGATDKLVKHQAQFGCEYNRSMWDNPRVHLTLETDASDPKQLGAVPLPEELDIILDDGSHKFLDQQRTLHTLWPRLRPGGFYVIEDMLVGALPWSKEHAKQVPSANSNCGVECFFPQRLAEHPFLFDRFGHLKGDSAPAVALEERTQKLLRANDWFWVITGVHQGGGLDASMFIRKVGPPLQPSPSLMPPSLSATCPVCVDLAALSEAKSELAKAEAMLTKLQEQQVILTTRLQHAETECARQPELDAGPGACTDWPFYLVLAASMVGNFILWRRRHSRTGGNSFVPK